MRIFKTAQINIDDFSYLETPEEVEKLLQENQLRLCLKMA